MKKNNTVLLVQARCTSSRLPRKVLSDIGGIPYILRVLNRLQRCKRIDMLVMITSEDSSDDELATICKLAGFNVFRGSLLDLLDRHYKAALLLDAKIIIKIPSDCPFSDPILVDEIIDIHNSADGRIDYTSNYHPATFPDGLDVEVFSFEALKLAWENATLPWEREHCTPYIWGHPEKFSLCNITNKKGPLFNEHRWTLDYAEDLELIKAVYREFDYSTEFSWLDVLHFLNANRDVASLNHIHRGTSWYGSVEDIKQISGNTDTY
jgi:spore coat polysaccharide biosynthesis protein SpsF